MVKEFSGIKDLKLSEKLIFRILYHHGPLTKNEILGYTEGSLSTIQRMLNKLEESRVILSSESKVPTGGRKPVSYRVNSEAYYTLGGYITWDAFGVGLGTINGKVLMQIESEISDAIRPTELVSRIRSSVDSILQETGIDRKQVLGMSFSSPGPQLKEKGILYHPHHLDLVHWDVVPIKDMLEMALDLPVTVNNLADTALLGELMMQTVTTQSRAAYIFLDNGIGTALFIPGMMDINKNDSSGNLGHMIIDLHGEPCVCGNRGCLETYVSIGALLKRFCRILPCDKNSTIENCSEKKLASKRWETSRELCIIKEFLEKQPLEENPLVEELMEDLSVALGAGIKNFINLIRPATVLMGGRVVKQFPELVDRAIEKSRENPYLEVLKEVSFLQSDFSAELLIRGGAYQVFDNYIGLIKPVSM